jgi:hypothetical protein
MKKEILSTALAIALMTILHQTGMAQTEAVSTPKTEFFKQKQAAGKSTQAPGKKAESGVNAPVIDLYNEESALSKQPANTARKSAPKADKPKTAGTQSQNN